VEHGRADDELETRRPRHPRPAAVEDEVKGQAVDGVAKEAPRQALRLARAGSLVRSEGLVLHVVHGTRL
jgi:hypothetical protein